MKQTKRKGASNTKGIRHILGDKVVSKRRTGNINQSGSRKNNSNNLVRETSLLTKLSPKGKANYFKIQEFLTENSKYATSEDFAGRGLLVDILDIENRSNGKYGPGVTIRLLDCKSNKERIWNTSSITAVKAIGSLLKQGITRMYIWKTGSGQDTRYYTKGAEAATHKTRVNTGMLQKRRRNAKR